MGLSIGRLGWTGISFQTAFNVPSAPTDYIPWETNTLNGIADQMAVTDAHGVRDSNFNSVPGKQSGAGELKAYAYTGLVGYLIGAVLGTNTQTNLGNGAWQHAFTENQTNTPLYLNLINNRVVDQEYYPNIAVSSVDLEVGIDLASVDAKVVGGFPFTTTSGNFTTISGNILSFKQVLFGVGSSVGNALSNLYKTTSVKLTIDNKSEAIWAHGAATPYAIVHKNIEVKADIELYFENTNDKQTFYNQTKKAAVFEFDGAPIGASGYNEKLSIRLYQITFKTFTVNTGLDNFQAEKIQIMGEYSLPDGKTIDALLINGNGNY